MDDPTVAAARARALAAKARLDASLGHAKARLNPRMLAADAVDTATDKAVEAAQSGLQIVRDRPATAAAVVGAIGVIAARRPLFGWIGRHRHGSDETAATPTSSDPSKIED